MTVKISDYYLVLDEIKREMGISSGGDFPLRVLDIAIMNRFGVTQPTINNHKKNMETLRLVYFAGNSVKLLV